MEKILRHRGLRLVFAANMVSMIGSGLNVAAVTWYVLQATHSELNLAWLVVLQTIPAMLMLPFTGVIIDREDRRRLVMLLDVVRALVIATVTVLAFRHQLQLWHLYLMNTLVFAGFWMFWPTVTALIQELTPDSEFIHSNSFLLAGVQGGFLIAGAIVGFVYNHIGISGILFIDVCTYLTSFALYWQIRKGRHLVARPERALTVPSGEDAASRYLHELKEGLHFLRRKPAVTLVGGSWSIMLGAMMTNNIVIAPLSDRVLKAGAVGYGWMNGAWGIGAFLSVFYTASIIRTVTGRKALAISIAALALGMLATPYSKWLAVTVFIFLIMGSARGVGGTAVNSALMTMVPPHFMGRVQNTFYFAGTFLQLILGAVVGVVAHRWSLTAAFALISMLYGIAFLLTAMPVSRYQLEPRATVS